MKQNQPQPKPTNKKPPTGQQRVIEVPRVRQCQPSLKKQISTTRKVCCVKRHRYNDLPVF